MADIKVNSTAMREKAGNLRSSSSSIRNFTNEMTTEIESLRSYWEGDAGETLVQRFKALAPRFDEICNTINDYGTFLDQAADSFDKTEEANKAGAESQRI